MYSHGYLVKSNSPILLEVGLFRLILVYSTSFLLIPTYCGWLWVIPYFIKKAKVHKARQNVETLKKVNARKARK